MFRNKLFVRLFIAMLVVMFTATVGIASFEYGLLEDNMNENIYNTQKGLLDKQLAAVEDTIGAVQSMCTNIIMSYDVSRLIENRQTLDNYEDIQMIKRVINLLNIQSAIYDTVDAVYLYDFSDGFRIASGNAAMQYTRIDDSLRTGFISRIKGTSWIETTGNFMGLDLNGRIAVVNGYYYGLAGIKSALVVTLDFDKLTELIQRDIQYGKLFLIDESGNVIAGTAPEEVRLDWLIDAYGENADGDLLYQKKHSAILNWDCCIVTEIKNNAAMFRRLHILEISITSSIIAAGVIVAYCFTRVLYSPIRNVVGKANQIVNVEKGEKIDEVKLIDRAISLLMARAEEADRRNVEHEREKKHLENQVLLREANAERLFFCELLYGSDRDEARLKQEITRFIPYAEGVIYLVLICGIDAINESLHKEVRGVDFYFYRCENELMVALAFLSERTNFDERCLYEGTEELIGMYGKETIALIGGPCDGLNGVSGEFYKLVTFAHERFAFSGNVVMCREAAHGTDESSLYKIKDALCNAIVNDSGEQVQKQLEAYKTALFECSPAVVNYKYHCRELLALLQRCIPSDQKVLETACVDFDMLFSDAEAFFRWTGEYTKRIFREDDAEQEKHYSAAVTYVLRRIEDDFSRDLSLTELASEINMSEQYVSRLFHDETGTGFKDYLTNVRLKHACELLQTTALKVEDIAQRIGYNNSKQFIRMFKKYCGKTPGAYRNDRLEGNDSTHA